MNLYIFKTDIQTPEKVHYISSLLSKREDFGRWSIDTEDVDNVFKVEVSKHASQKEILDFVRANGFYCEAL